MMKKFRVVIFAVIWVTSSLLLGCPKVPNVTIQVVFTPYAVPAANGTTLVYELLLSDYRKDNVELEMVEVYGDGALLRSYTAAELASQDSAAPALLALPKATKAEDAGSKCLQPVLYFGFTLTPQETVPTSLSHILYFRTKAAPFNNVFSVPGGDANMNTEPLMTIQNPFKDSRMVSVDAVAPYSSHRRAVRMYGEKAYISQRFAVDWSKLTEDGKLSSGPATDLNTYPGYGIDILAVAPGKIVKVVEGIPDNQTPPGLDITLSLENITGNGIVLQISENRFARYGHCIPGSILVHEGDEVVAGQVLARMGNSGASELPHLHFHISDTLSLYGGQGIPYVIAAFDHQADFPYWQFDPDDILAMAEQCVWTPLAEPSLRTNEFVYNGLVAEFQ